jgi:hypothetical protein
MEEQNIQQKLDEIIDLYLGSIPVQQSGRRRIEYQKLVIKILEIHEEVKSFINEPVAENDTRTA